MKIVLELKNTPNKNDILVYNGSEWECISTNQYLSKIVVLEQEQKELKEKYENDIQTLKEKINEKLEQYHKILQLLVKEE